MRKSSEARSSLGPDETRATFIAKRSLMQRFHAVARRQDVTFSQEMRRHMREFVERGEAEADQEEAA